MTLSCDSRARRNPATSTSSSARRRSYPRGTSWTGSEGHRPLTSPSLYTSRGSAQSRWMNRDAVGAASSHPAAATSEGFAAATNATVSGSCSAPTS